MNLTTHKKESGTAIVLVISILITLMVIIGVAVEYTTTISRHVQRSDTLGSAIAIGDGCIENMFAYWREACRAKPNQALTTNDLANLQLPQPSQWPTPIAATSPFVTSSPFDDTKQTLVQQCKVIAVDPEWNTIDPSATPPPGVGQQTVTKTYNYLATAFVTLPTLKGTTAQTGAVVAKVQRVFLKEQFSPWNWAIFYIDPLEIHPGAPFNVTGWVHTNSNLYTAHNYLHFLDKVTYGSDWSIDFAPGDPRLGTETPTTPSWPANMPPALDVQHQPFGIDFGSVLDMTWPRKDTNQNNDGYHELIEPAAPGAGNTPDPFSPTGAPRERYYDQAGVIIEIDASNNVTLKKPDGSGGTIALTSSSTGNDLALYNMFNASGVISTNYTIQDNREGGAQVRVATLDVGKIIDSSSGNWKAGSAFNGIVYMRDTSADSTNGDPSKTPSLTLRRGIRLKNGASIPPGGLTVASANAIYLQGDFNTGSNPPSNNSTSDPTQPTGTTVIPQGSTPVGGVYVRQPSSIVGDAVYILSNAWTDSWGGSGVGLSTRVASNTTVNAAIVSGIVPTNYNNNNTYSGGAENFPRFNENWSGKNITYYGSMVELYASQQAVGNWGSANVYNAPNRQWYFDNIFKTSAPPGSLMIYNYIKGRWSLL